MNNSNAKIKDFEFNYERMQNFGEYLSKSIGGFMDPLKISMIWMLNIWYRKASIIEKLEKN